jgi:hypothetical protein
VTLPTDPAERHRAVADGFTARVRGASVWDAPAPVTGWRARDVVGHLVGWFPGFLQGGTGLVLDRGPSPEEDPVTAWRVQADALQRLLDGPEADLVERAMEPPFAVRVRHRAIELLVDGDALLVLDDGRSTAVLT